MKRITKYEPSEDSMFPYKLVDNELSTELNAIHQLGRFEDLMQEYNINSIQELENILGSKFIAGFFRSSGKTIVAKGILYNKLSEELGCPLEVVFKMLENGITFEHEGVNLRSDSIHLFYFNHKWNMRAYAFIQGYGSNAYDFELKNYGKTWWLKGEKENE